jgi:zinc protease
MRVTRLGVLLAVASCLGCPHRPTVTGPPGGGPGTPPASPDLTAKRSTVIRTLPSGLTVLVEENHSTPVVAVQVWVAVGSADETPAEAGLAHFFEHMLFKGTDKRPVGAIAADIEGAGGDINAWTSYDETVYHVVLASRFFDTGLDVLADAVSHSRFDPADIEGEIKVVLEEIKRGHDNPSRVVSEELFDLAYGAHPYGRNILGSDASVRAFTRERVLAFFHRWYVPATTTVVIAGDVRPEAVLRRVEKAFADYGHAPGTAGGGAATAAAPARKPTAVALPDAPRARVKADSVKEARFEAGFPIPPLLDDDIVALDVLAVLLGQGESSRLNEEVRRNRLLVNDVYSFAYTPRQEGLFIVGATLQAENVAAATEATMREVFRLAHEEPASDEVTKARTIIESDAVYQVETVQGLARKLGFYRVIAGDLAHEARYYAALAKVTPADVRRVAAKYLRPDRLSLAAVVPTALAADDAAAHALEKALLAETKKAAEGAAAESALPAVAPGAGGVVKVTLPSGATVLLKRTTTSPVVAVRAVFNGGLRFEDASNNGVNNMLARLITSGTATRDASALSLEVDKIAGSLSGYSGKNSFGLRGEFLARNFERGMELFADCLLHPEFPPDEIKKERKEVLEEIAARDDDPAGVAFRLFAETLYHTHPYRMDSLGTEATVKKISRATLAAYYGAHFPISEVTLVIVGDIDPAKALAVARRWFGRLPSAATAPAPRPVLPVEATRTAPEVAIRDLSKEQAHVVFGWMGPAMTSPDRYALEVISAMLGAQGGRLFRELREEKGLAYSVSSVMLDGVEAGYLAVHVGTSPENVDATLAGIKAEVEKMVAGAPDPDEVERAKRFVIGTHEISLQRASALAASMGFAEAYGLGYADYITFPERIAAVTPADVARVAKEYLGLDRYVLALVKPGDESAADDAPAGSPGPGPKGKTAPAASSAPAKPKAPVKAKGK